MSEPSEKLAVANAVCDACGRHEALEIGDRRLCAECVALAGSAGAGALADDGSE